MTTLSTRGILKPSAVAQRFQLARHAPGSALAPFVDRFWIVRWDLRGQPPHTQETLPHPAVHLAIESKRSAVHGVATRRFQARLDEKGQVVGVKFRPGGFVPFLRGSAALLDDRVIPLLDFFGAAAAGLEAEVLADEDDARQLAVLEAFLLSRRPRPDPRIDEVAALVELVTHDRHITSVATLARASGKRERTLQRLFRDWVGKSPKWVIRRARMHEAAERVAAGTDLVWTALADELGYFDQAHFINDFRDQVGRTPAEYAAWCRDQRA